MLKTFNRFDFLNLAIIAVATLLFLFTFFTVKSVPFEDAAMLMRYAQHTADGHGIVWNIGSPPVDGATDFLFMVLVALLIKLGLSVQPAVLLLTTLAHILTTILIYFTARYLFHAPRSIASTAALAFSIGPGLNYITAYLATPLFAFFVALSWFLALYYSLYAPKFRVALILSITMLLASLTRPEGVFMTIFIISALIYIIGWRSSKDVLWYSFLTFSIFGSLYFFWHWHYFGYPFPNPFYRKGGGMLYPNSLYVALRNTLALTGAFLVFLFFPVKNFLLRRVKVAVLFPLIGFTLIWILVSSEMNYFRRFQYVLLPIILMIWPAFAAVALGHLSRLRHKYLAYISSLALPALMVLLFISLQYVQHFDPRHRNLNDDGRYHLAQALSPYKDAHYTLLTTEAGLLPLYSGWFSIDAWGLNDKFIAHHGTITEQYINANQPAIIMFHKTAWPDPSVLPSSRWLPDTLAWPKMIKILEDYAIKNNYTLAANWGPNRFNTHVYYVNKAISHHDEFVRLIRNRQYSWYADGQAATNYLSD